MQVILTEEEWLTLKGQSEKDKKTYVKRIDVAMALEDLVKDLFELRTRNDPSWFRYSQDDFKRVIDEFHKKIS